MGFGGKTNFNKGGSWHSQRTIVPEENRTSPDGIVHRTRAACNRWNQLRLLQQAGHIRNLRREVKYKLEMLYFPVNGCKDCEFTPEILQIKSRKGNVRTYTADFVYEVKEHSDLVALYGRCAESHDMTWWEIIEDIKGFLEPAQELRLDVFAALYGVRVFINKV